MGKFTKGNVQAKRLTAEKVLEIRLKYSEGQSQGSLAREYEVSVGQVGRIVRGEVWQNFQQVEPTQAIEERLAMMQSKPSDKKINESLAKLAAKLEESTAPTVLHDPLIEDDGEDSFVIDKLRKDIAKEDPLRDLLGDDK
jgi:hypothetical protein